PKKPALLPPIQVKIDPLRGVGVPTFLSGDREGHEDRVLRIDLVPDRESADRLAHGLLNRRLMGPGVLGEEGVLRVGDLRLDDSHMTSNMLHQIFKMLTSSRGIVVSVLLEGPCHPSHGLQEQFHRFRRRSNTSFTLEASVRWPAVKVFDRSNTG